MEIVFYIGKYIKLNIKARLPHSKYTTKTRHSCFKIW